MASNVESKIKGKRGPCGSMTDSVWGEIELGWERGKAILSKVGELRVSVSNNIASGLLRASSYAI